MVRQIATYKMSFGDFSSTSWLAELQHLKFPAPSKEAAQSIVKSIVKDLYYKHYGSKPKFAKTISGNLCVDNGWYIFIDKWSNIFVEKSLK